MQPPPSYDRAAREPVWRARSELYLDTDLVAAGEFGIRAVARALAGSPYSVEEIRAIEACEVAPVGGPNLLTVGEGAPWGSSMPEVRPDGAGIQRLRW